MDEFTLMFILSGTFDEILNSSGIYCIFNKLSSKLYIGSALNMSKRLYTHSQQLADNKHHSILLQRAYNKYGKENFEIFILEKVKDKSKLLEREQFWLDLNKSYDPELGYNLSPTAGSILGIKYSDQARANLSAAMTDERKAALSAHFKGKICGPRSEKIKNKIKTTLTGQKLSDDRKRKISEGLKKFNADKKAQEIAKFASGII